MYFKTGFLYHLLKPQRSLNFLFFVSSFFKAMRNVITKVCWPQYAHYEFNQIHLHLFQLYQTVILSIFSELHVKFSIPRNKSCSFIPLPNQKFILPPFAIQEVSIIFYIRFRVQKRNPKCQETKILSMYLFLRFFFLCFLLH